MRAEDPATAYDRPMRGRVVILGAGFGGLELATMLSDALGDDVDVALIDKNDAFVFGYSKLDVMFGRATPDSVRLPYSAIAKPGVRFVNPPVAVTSGINTGAVACYLRDPDGHTIELIQPPPSS